MKPDGVAMTPVEPTEAQEAEPEVESVEEQPQEDQSPSPPQPEEPKNMHDEESVPATLAKGHSSQTLGPKTKTKAPVKTGPGPPGPKATTTGAASRPGATRAANNVTRTFANGVAKKPATAQTEVKKAPPGPANQLRKGPPAQKGAAALPQRTQVKVAERKPVGATRQVVGSTNSRPRPTTTASSTLSKKPATTATSAAAKPKTTAPRPVTAPAKKPTVAAASKSAPSTKTTRPATAPIPRSATTRPAASRTAASVPPTAQSASSQASKFSKKDICKPSTSAPARKPVASSSSATTSRPTATKTLKPEASKPALTAKRLPAVTKTTVKKPDESKSIPTRKVPPSPRNAQSRPATGKTTAESSSPKHVGSSTPVHPKRQPTRPTQSVLPLVIKREPTEEPPEPVELSASLESAASAATTTAIAEPVPDVQAPLEGQVEHLDQHITAPAEIRDDADEMLSLEPLNVETVPTMAGVEREPLGEQLVVESPVFAVLGPPSAPEVQEACRSDVDYIMLMGPTGQEGLLPEPAADSQFDLPVTATVTAEVLDAVEKAEQIIPNEDDEEEEKEGSQQVSVSDMSGTQPTEESRPGSAGLAGSVWRAGGLASELDSEDVSCSQQGASELSAPGVLEGTESIDDLGDASLKGADGEGASAGSPDFEKVPDIPANEDDDDEDDDDRVCDMEVGSERGEDLHRQCHDNEDEDEDVEMASEGITESGLESYGNADEDDFAEDYRLDNLNRMQVPSIVPSAPPAAQWGQANPFADPWAQPPQPDLALLSSPPSNPWQPDSVTATQAPAQTWLDVGNAEGCLSSPNPSALMEPAQSSPQYVPVHAAEMEVSLKPGLAPNLHNVSHSSTLSDAELHAHSCSNTSTPEELKEGNKSPGMEIQPVLVNPVPVNLPDLMQDLAICLDRGDEEPETLPADDASGGLGTAPASAPSSSSATREASDTEGELSEPTTEPGATGHECFSSTQVVQSFPALQEREEACAETEGGGGSDTPQSATSAASYGFDCTSNSNAQSTTESCAKSPGIFSLENEEQLPDEAKDPSLIKELTLTPTGAPGDGDLVKIGQQGERHPNSEQPYMLCGKASEEIPESCSLGSDVPIERGLTNTSSENQDDDWDRNNQHLYYSTICEKTDGSLAGRNVCFLQTQETPTVNLSVFPKPCLRPRVDHVTHLPHLPVDLSPRVPSTEPNTQLRRLERHQQQLLEIERRHERQNRPVERREEAHEDGAPAEAVEEEKEEELEKGRELENQRRELLQLQQQERKQRQQTTQRHQELEQQTKQHKAQPTVVLSPSGLCTIYEALEPNDAEEDLQDKRKVDESGRKVVMKEKVEMVECENSSEDMDSNMETDSSPPKNSASLQPHDAAPSPEPFQVQGELTPPAALNRTPLSSSHPPPWPCPPELDWGKKVDIVQQLINQSLLLAGDGCPSLLLTSAGGTLSPLETSLWPDLLPPITPPSATVTCVSSFSPEASSSSQGEWTVVEVETHH